MIKRVYRGFISLFLFFLSLFLLWLLGIKNLESRLKAGYQAQYLVEKFKLRASFLMIKEIGHLWKCLIFILKMLGVRFILFLLKKI